MIPLLSVVVPTHNRSKYAYHCISTILSIDDSRFELIVSDTSTNDLLYELLNKFPNRLIDNPRLKYFRPLEKLDMTGNHNFAISKSNGEYICLIGDDDTITIDAIYAAEWAKNANVEIISPQIMTNYVWPDFKSLTFGDSHSARLYIPRYLGKMKKVESKFAIDIFLSNASQGTDNLPKIYHGIVKKSLLDKIHLTAGNYFFGSSPDVSGAVALSLCSSSFIRVSYPLTIPGASGGSNTGRSALNQHKGELKDEEQTNSFSISGWSEFIPHFFSVETVWAHAAIETINKIEIGLLEKFNFAKLIALCQIKHPEYNSQINHSISKIIVLKNTNSIKFSFEIQIQKILYFINRFRYILFRALIPTAAGGRKYIKNIENIENAFNAFNNYKNSRKWSWLNYIKNL